MDRYEVMAGKMTPLTDGAHRKWGFTGKVETRSYERLVDALIDFVETGDGVTEDEEGMVPDDATVAYISTLDGSREERAFELAKHDYYGFLDYKEDRYTTVYGYMD